MRYEIELFDYWGRRLAVYDEVPLLDAVRSMPDGRDEVVGLLPKDTASLAPGYRVRVSLDGRFFCDCRVEETSPEWSDAQKLVLDRYVSFHEVMGFRAYTPYRNGNVRVSSAYTNREISAIVKDLLNRARGPIHYWVGHEAYPEGAQREYAKFLARKTAENELEAGGISSGQWVGADRMDLSSAYTKDGDTISGVWVDGAPWPDIRLLMVDAEETSRNSHGIGRHPEVAFWTEAEYAASGYQRKGEAAKAFLQSLLDTKGIDYIELNPHRNASGAYDDRVDAYGRYIAMVYGGGECFNAALVEQGLADVYLYEDGKYHVPEQELKDFYSYVGPHTDSVETCGTSLGALDVGHGLFEILAALSYAAGHFVFSVDAELGVSFRRAERAGRVLSFDPIRHGVRFGQDASSLSNYLYVQGNPLAGAVSQSFGRSESIDAYGLSTGELEFFPLRLESDAALLAEGLLDDVAYPSVNGEIAFYGGESSLNVGDVLELRGAPLRALSPGLSEEWGGCFAGRMVGRVAEIRHRFTGKHVLTRARLTSPLRSVESPLSFMVRSQEAGTSLFEFRLDEAQVGLDLGYHLD